jgi:hypothetical protein
VRLQHEKSTITTICFCDSASNMRKMLAELFGKNNVLSVSEIVSESPQTDQIQIEQAIRPQAVQRRAQLPKVALIQSSQVQQQSKRPRKRRLSTRAIADPIKHDLVQNRLTKQFMRQSNIVKPTTDDIRIARNRAETELKKADLDFKKRSDELRRNLEQQSRKNG